MTILAAVFLSVYRITNSRLNLALFIAFSVLNSIYTCKRQPFLCHSFIFVHFINREAAVWDLFMDFSLLQRDARVPLLRDILALKRRWVYYLIMSIDPILRFGWIFYAIFTHDTQHSSIVSFLVGFLEISRRGMWTLLRVENEHCTNVAHYKASRDVPLPYQLPVAGRTSADATGGPSDGDKKSPSIRAPASTAPTPQQAAEAESRRSPVNPLEESGLRRQRPSGLRSTKSIRDIMASAHRQDFVKKRRPADEATSLGAAEDSGDDIQTDEDADDDDEEDETGSAAEDRLEVNCVQSLVRRNGSEDEDNNDDA
ncbi:EXS family-domain-containing protein [Xylariaceae sp. FL0255]|nr:EXS family-domain-containing protein [Xylariaceae sp. FL0255]